MDDVAGIAVTFASGVAGALITIVGDRWGGSRARRQAGWEAIQDFQRVLSDFSSYLLARDGVFDDFAVLEKIEFQDVAVARRAAYPYKDLLAKEDRELITRSGVEFDPMSGLPYDARQPAINDWAMDLDRAISDAFKKPWKR